MIRRLPFSRSCHRRTCNILLGIRIFSFGGAAQGEDRNHDGNFGAVYGVTLWPSKKDKGK